MKRGFAPKASDAIFSGELDDEALAFMVRTEAERVLEWWPARLQAQREPNGPVSQRRRRELREKQRRNEKKMRGGAERGSLEPEFNRDERNWCQRGCADLNRAVSFARRALEALHRGDTRTALARGFQMAVHETRGTALYVGDEEGNRRRRKGAGKRNEAQGGEARDYQAAIERALDHDPQLQDLPILEVMRRLQDQGVLPGSNYNGDFPQGASERTQQRWIGKVKSARANR